MGNAPTPASADLLNRALELHRAGRLDEAAAIYQRLLADNAEHADAAHLLGLVHLRGNDLDSALRLIRQAVLLDPDNPIYRANLGNALKDAGRLTDAIPEYRRALALRPGYAEIHNNLGYVLQASGMLEEGIDHYRTAIALNPTNFRAHYNLGNALYLTGRSDEAIAAFRQAATLNPAFADTWDHLGIVLQRLGRHPEAAACFRRWIEIDPDSADAYHALAFELQQQGLISEAQACYERALTLRPDFPEAGLHLAGLLEDENRLPEALACSQRVIERSPDHLQAAASAHWLAQKLCDWTTAAVHSDQVLRGAARRPECANPFQLFSLPGASRKLLLASARSYAAMVAPLKPLAQHTARFGLSPRIRLGYLSRDFYEHATAYLTAEVFELHDRERFEVFLFSYGPNDGSAARKRLEAGCDRFVDLAEDSNDVAARRIRDEGIQVLVDLKGYTTGSRPQIAAWRPSPVQVSWLGFPGSMGADWIDYLIADSTVVPPQHDVDYAEKIVRVPHCYQSNDRKRPMGLGGPPRDACGLSETDFVFCCFNQSYKIEPGLFAIWMRLLGAVPDSVLWLLEDNQWARANLQREAAGRGIAPERLIFAPRRPLAEHLTRYTLADLALDTFPYTSHTTGSDALWAGCPMVTTLGETFASRVAASLLRNVGLGALVTDSLAAYEALALDLARDRSRLDALRRGLRAARNSAPLFDSPRFTRNLEFAYERMWARFAGGHGPQAFDANED